MMMIRRNGGYSLLEVMITVTIVAILTSIAIPSYTGHLRKARRGDAMAALQQFANAMERYRLTNGNYIGADGGGGVPGNAAPTIFPASSPLDGTPKFYDLTIEVLGATTYTLRATPFAVNIPGVESTAQLSDGIIELDSTGAQSWDEDNDGVMNNGPGPDPFNYPFDNNNWATEPH